jgi:beta-fructofuranosidase
MNDPNGLWYDNTTDEWHLYYQYNPNGTVWGLPLFWGHATSPDGLNWEDKGIAVAPPKYTSGDAKGKYNGGAYSGSCVIDEDNTSGFFSGASDLDPAKRVVSIWTFNADDWYESQYISYSIDGGETFKHYRMNPVVSMNSTQFRDPQVIRYVDGNDTWWVMSVAKSHQYRIQFYKSNNLKNWRMAGYFELYGFLGYQYECPNLAKMKYEGSTQPWAGKKDENGNLWVLFISINPGSMQGGSSTQYFIGNFDGYKFTPIRNYTAPIDYGKDFYALQIFFNSPKDTEDNEQTHGIAWTSNWQYSGSAPTDNWRSSMSFIRKFVLDDFESAPGTKIAYIKSTPVINTDKILYGTEYTFNSTEAKLTYLNPKYTLDFSDYVNGAVEFNLKFKVFSGQWTKSNPANFFLDFRGYAIPDEYLRLGYQCEAGAFIIDRGHTNVEWVHENRFFTDKLSVNIQTSKTGDGYSEHTVVGYIDRNIVELYFNDGFQVATNTFFMTGGNFIGSVDISLDSIDYDFTNWKYYEPFEINLSVKQIIHASNQ